MQAAVQAIVFDVDGTLAETDEFYIDSAAKGLRPLFFFLSAQRLRRLIRRFVMSGETLMNFLLWFADVLHLDFLFNALHNRISAKGADYRYALIQNARAALLELRKTYRLAILTAGGQRSTEAFLRKYDLEALFEVVVTAQTCARTKPSGMPLLYALRQMNLTPADCLVVGDTIFDLLTAKRAGARFIGVRTGFDGDWLLKHFGAETIIDSVADLPALPL